MMRTGIHRVTVWKEELMPGKRPSVKNEKQYEGLKDKGMSKERAAKIANSPGALKRGGKKSGSGGSSKLGWKLQTRRNHRSEEGGGPERWEGVSQEELTIDTFELPDNQEGNAGSRASARIADYALIGDTRTAALIHRQGSIDWMCAPRFDSTPLFSRLVDDSGGHFSIEIRDAKVLERVYDGTTLVTTWRSASGEVEVRDTLVSRVTGNLLPGNVLVRELRGLGGSVEAVVRFNPRRGMPSRDPAVRKHGEAFVCTWGELGVAVTSDSGVPLELGRNFFFTLDEGESKAIVVTVSFQEPITFLSPDKAKRMAADDGAWWDSWIEGLSYEGPEADVVKRSLVVLRLLTYSPSGAPVAAPTTSLPEWAGSGRNWDYRYAWPRDASIGISAFLQAGYMDEAEAFMRWLLHASRVTRPQIEVMYTVDGNPVPPEREIDVSGFAASKPVRVGNAARDQFQLDVYGWVVDGFARLVEEGGSFSAEVVRAMTSALDFVSGNWSQKDNGIWEVRGDREHYVHSKMMCWLALDRAAKLPRIFDSRKVAGWEPQRDLIARSIRGEGFDIERGSYVRSYGSRHLDASILLPLSDFEKDPLIVNSTIDAIRSELGASGSLVYRYRCSDSLQGPQGAFLPCSFWLVEALARSGRVDEAEDIFAEACVASNDLLLLSEEIDPASGELLGNFPQALTHGSLVMAGQAIAKAREGGRTSQV